MIREQPGRSADFQVCCVAGFQTRRSHALEDAADLEIGDTAGLETCATKSRRLRPGVRQFALSLIVLLCGHAALAGKIQFTYDSADRLTAADYGAGRNTLYTYDPNICSPRVML